MLLIQLINLCFSIVFCGLHVFNVDSHRNFFSCLHFIPLQKFGQIPKFKACMDWAEPSNLLDVAKDEDNYKLYECVPRFVTTISFMINSRTEVVVLIDNSILSSLISW